jgi:hypothetical protein
VVVSHRAHTSRSGPGQYHLEWANAAALGSSLHT